MFKKLNLPSFDYKVKEVDRKPFIFDVIRRKYVFLSPEEWVRQHLIHFLINQYQYPRSLFAIETGLYYHTLKKRSDIMVLGSDGNPFLLVECKAPEVNLKQQVFEQIARYHFSLKPSYLAVSNGMQHYCFRVDPAGGIEFLTDFPPYNTKPIP